MTVLLQAAIAMVVAGVAAPALATAVFLLTDGYW